MKASPKTKPLSGVSKKVILSPELKVLRRLKNLSGKESTVNSWRLAHKAIVRLERGHGVQKHKELIAKCKAAADTVIGKAEVPEVHVTLSFLPAINKALKSAKVVSRLEVLSGLGKPCKCPKPAKGKTIPPLPDVVYEFDRIAMEQNSGNSWLEFAEEVRETIDKGKHDYHRKLLEQIESIARGAANWAERQGSFTVQIDDERVRNLVPDYEKKLKAAKK